MVILKNHPQASNRYTLTTVNHALTIVNHVFSSLLTIMFPHYFALNQHLYYQIYQKQTKAIYQHKTLAAAPIDLGSIWLLARETSKWLEDRINLTFSCSPHRSSMCTLQ
jgi:hypothetical protein